MDLTPILEATVSANTEQLQQATKILEKLAEENLCLFLKKLAEELASVNKSIVARTAAGLQLKNYLTSKDLELKVHYQQRWLSFPIETRLEIKTLVMSALGTEMSRPMSSPQCIAYIASAELSTNQWQDLIPTLAANVTNPQSSETLKIASLDSIGYICEDVSSSVLAVYSNQILTAIIQGMRKEEPSMDVRLSAAKALNNSLEFTKANFEKESERHFIMQVVCEATQCPNVSVVVAALQNLVKIMTLYYQYMEAYMGPAVFAITLEAMKCPEDDVALQAIEFWSSVCDEEADLAIEALEAMELGQPPSQTSYHYVRGALQFLVPILLLTLTKQEEYDDEDDWNPCKAAGVCLSLMATCTDDSMIQHVLPFVIENINSHDWKFRDASIMALGSIMEGPDSDSLTQHISQNHVVSKIIERMSNDPSVQVQDTAAWTIGRICEHAPATILQRQDNTLSQLLQTLYVGLSREPRVAANICWALSSLCEAAYDYALSTSTTDTVETYVLSTSYAAIAQQILATTSRGDSAQSNLRTSAYEALMDVIKYSAKDCYGIVQQTAVAIIERLRSVVQLGNSDIQGHDKQQLADLESLLCATLQNVIRKLDEADIAQLSDTIMETLLIMLSTTSGQTGGVQEDALLTIGVLVEVVTSSFIKYMELFHPYLKAALKNYADIQVCQAAVGLVGDLCRALSVDILKYCDEIMDIMVDTLSNPLVHRAIKPPILSTIGDVALAIGSEFKKYANPVLTILEQASRMPLEKYDFDMIDYVNELREGCLEGYTGIVQGLKGDSDTQVNADVQLVMTHVPWILTFLETIGNDEDKTDSNISFSAGLLGDLLSVFGIQLLPLINQRPAIHKLLQEGKQSRIKRTKTLSTWVLRTVRSLQGEPTGSKGK